jgi:hypothetical protein
MVGKDSFCYTLLDQAGIGDAENNAILESARQLDEHRHDEAGTVARAYT